MDSPKTVFTSTNHFIDISLKDGLKIMVFGDVQLSG